MYGLTGLAHWAFAEEGGNAVVAGGTVEADGRGAVVDVLAAVVAGPAVDADAGVAADGVEARAAVVAGVGLHQALVHVLSTVLACRHKQRERERSAIGLHKGSTHTKNSAKNQKHYFYSTILHTM